MDCTFYPFPVRLFKWVCGCGFVTTCAIPCFSGYFHFHSFFGHASFYFFDSLGGLSVTPPSASPAASSATETTYQSTFVTPKGLLGIIAYTMMSGMAGVYNECILKEHKQVIMGVKSACNILM